MSKQRLIKGLDEQLIDHKTGECTGEPACRIAYTVRAFYPTPEQKRSMREYKGKDNDPWKAERKICVCRV